MKIVLVIHFWPKAKNEFRRNELKSAFIFKNTINKGKRTLKITPQNKNKNDLCFCYLLNINLHNTCIVYKNAFILIS